jgi:hypothetical protein
VEWTEKEHTAFETVKQIMSREVLLSCLDFMKPFEIHRDAPNYQMGTTLHQGRKPTAFCSEKVNAAQQKHTTAEQEPFAIVATLKEFENILVGHEAIICMDHKNLTCEDFNSDRVIDQQIALERFGVTLNYVQGEGRQCSGRWAVRITCHRQNIFCS